jgi:EAL domain-containing protein (putative c-di-GMP-specific phosphodiesterase class I)
MQEVEALVRWRHPRYGVLFPSQFLGATRSARLMTALTDFIMTEAVRQTGQWRQQGLELGVTVNLEPWLVRDIGFAERLARLLCQFDVPPERFTLEVIESASARDRELLAGAMTAVRKQGIRLSLDDFGTGNSSLNELHRLPFTDLKIDRSLICDVMRSPKAATIVSGIVELAHRLSIRVCAEGVEGAETFEFLSSSACDAMQGVFLAKPTPAAAIERTIHGWVPERIAEAVAQSMSKLAAKAR